MKTSLSSLLTVAALALAVPLMAQAEKTTSGKVVSSTPEQIVVQTDDGSQMTFKVDAQSTVPTGMNAGSRVTVTYHELAGGMFHAARVAPTDTGTSATTPPTTTTTAQEPTPESTSTTGSSGRRMPATASPLPLVGLAGLLSLTAGLGLRALRRSV
jgi:type IV secretory pathway VirJ component